MNFVAQESGESQDPSVSEEEAEIARSAIAEHRARKAREEEHRQAWRPALAELTDALESEEENVAGELFVERASDFGWENDDQLRNFAIELVEALDLRPRRTRGGDLVWE